MESVEPLESASYPGQVISSPRVWSKLIGLAIMLRPQQWTKNLLCLAGIVFSGHFVNTHDWVAAWLTFAAFCLASSTGYIINDFLDRDRDREHPRKRARPLA